MSDTRKNKESFLPWLSGILAALFVVWMIMTAIDREMRMSSVEEQVFVQNSLAQTNIPMEVEVFLRFLIENHLREKSRGDISEGIIKLAEALQALTERDKVGDIDIAQKLHFLESKANFIKSDSLCLFCSDSLKGAFMLSALWLERLQIENYPQLTRQVQEVNEAAVSLDVLQKMFDQKQRINDFFDKSADVVRFMGNNSQDRVTEN
jgi:hypothetical protein